MPLFEYVMTGLGSRPAHGMLLFSPSGREHAHGLLMFLPSRRASNPGLPTVCCCSRLQVRRCFGGAWFLPWSPLSLWLPCRCLAGSIQ